MHQVLLTSAAKESIENIGRFIASQSQSLETAWRILDKIEEKCQLCAFQPRMGELRGDLALDVRSFPVENFVVIYKPHPEGIVVLLVVHSARDVPAVFRDLFGY